jgi:cytoskeletal protein RodZ
MTDYPSELRELFAEIGQKLKIIREGQGMPLEEVSSRTRINQSFLRMIEGGDLDGLPSLAFVKGFLRNMVQVLEIEDQGLDGDLDRLNLLDVKDSGNLLNPSNKKLYLEEPERPPILKIALWGSLAVLVLAAGFFIFSTPDSESPPEIEQPPEQASTAPAESSGSKETGSAEQSASPAGTGQPAADTSTSAATSKSGSATSNGQPAQRAPRRKLELTLRGLEQTWVRLSLDRAPPIDVRMEPSETLGWEANQEIRLTIGKSSGVEVYLNGEQILLPQEKNRLVRDLVLNKLTLLRLEN